MISTEELREKARAFLAEHAPKRRTPADDDDAAGKMEATAADLPTQKAFQAALFDAGLAGLTWPEPWGQGLPRAEGRHAEQLISNVVAFAVPRTDKATTFSGGRGA